MKCKYKLETFFACRENVILCIRRPSNMTLHLIDLIDQSELVWMFVIKVSDSAFETARKLSVKRGNAVCCVQTTDGKKGSHESYVRILNKQTYALSH